MTRWGPDTCKCILDMNEDWSDCSVVKKCAIHNGIADDDIYEAVYLNENQKKNYILGFIQANFPDMVKENPNTNCPYMKAYGIEGSVRFKEDRSIEVDLPGMSEQRKSQLRSYIDKEHAPKAALK